MKPQTLYTLAGLVWGLVLAPDAGLYAARMMGSVSWLYRFDDGAWADWIIVPFGILIGFTVLFSCYQLGAAAGRRYEDATDRRLRHAKSVPWALIVVGVAVGVITVLTIDERQRAVARYVQEQKDAAARLVEFARTVHRITAYSIEWPGGGAPGRVDLSFAGKRQGDYRFDWKIVTGDGTEPLVSGSYEVGLGEKRKSTTIPLSASEVANAYLLQNKKPGADLTVDARFRLVMELRPILTGKERDTLPDGEAARLEDGESILLKRARTEFDVRFEARGGRIVW